MTAAFKALRNSIDKAYSDAIKKGYDTPTTLYLGEVEYRLLTKMLNSEMLRFDYRDVKSAPNKRTYMGMEVFKVDAQSHLHAAP